jgi:hypothetical protein
MRSHISGIQIPTAARLNIDGEFTLDSLAGTSGQVLTSAGAGNTPTWTTISGGGSGFTGAGTSITGITATATSGSATVTASSITIAGGQATTSSNALGDNATGGNLTIQAGGAVFTGNSQGNATGGNLILDAGGVNSGAAGNPVYGTITMGSNASLTTIGAGYPGVGGILNLGMLGTTTVNIGLSDSYSGADTVNILARVGSNTKTLKLATDGGTTSIKIGTGATTPTIELGNNATASTTTIKGKVFVWQPTPTTTTTARTLTAAELLTFIVINSTATTGNLTLPTGTLMDTNVQNSFTDMAFNWSVINTAASGSVSVAAGTAHTVVGNMGVSFGTTGQFRSRRTGTNTWVTYRIS